MAHKYKAIVVWDDVVMGSPVDVTLDTRYDTKKAPLLLIGGDTLAILNAFEERYPAHATFIRAQAKLYTDAGASRLVIAIKEFDS